MPEKDELVKGFSIARYLKEQGDCGWSPDTRHSYRNCLYELLEFTRENGPLNAGLLQKWVKTLRKRYVAGSVNVRITAVNQYFRWCGRQDLILPRAQQEGGRTPQCLTRTEYLKLLRKARALDQPRTYLLVKLFATTDLPLQCLDQVTADVVKQGTATLRYRSSAVEFRCPETLQRELLEYMALNGIYHGPVFITRTGQPLDRTNIFRALRELCQAAGVPEEKGNPRSLRNLYRATQQAIDDRLTVLKQQMYDQMLEMEQEAIGWQIDPTTSRGRSA